MREIAVLLKPGTAECWREVRSDLSFKKPSKWALLTVNVRRISTEVREFVPVLWCGKMGYHWNVVDKVSLPWRPEFDLVRSLIWCCNFIMIWVFLCFCNTESKSLGRCCLLDRSKVKKIKTLLFFFFSKLKRLSFHIKSAW